MSKRKNVDFGTVLERSKSLNAKPESMKIDSAKRFKILKSQLESCKGSSQLSYTVEKSLESYMYQSSSNNDLQLLVIPTP